MLLIRVNDETCQNESVVNQDLLIVKPFQEERVREALICYR